MLISVLEVICRCLPVAKAAFPEKEPEFVEAMLCEVSEFAGNSLVGIFMTINILMTVFIFASLSSCFYYLYWPSMITYEKWKYKVSELLDKPKYRT